MNLSIDFGRWTTTKAALAVAGALAIAGAIGSAVAMSPIVQPPIKWTGGAEFTADLGGNGLSKVYTVPAGQNFILTDLIVGNLQTTAKEIALYTASAAVGCVSGALRLQVMVVPGLSTLAVPLQTGVGVPSGHAVCLSIAGPLRISGRGFLFTAAPAS